MYPTVPIGDPRSVRGSSIEAVSSEADTALARVT